MESITGNEREEVKEVDAVQASIDSKPSGMISHGSTTAILDDLEQLIINLNHTAMEYLRNDKFAMSIRLLHKAE